MNKSPDVRVKSAPHMVRPTWFSAQQVYVPCSSGVAFRTTTQFFPALSCPISVTSDGFRSFWPWNHEISGMGRPVTTHSKRATSPSGTEIDWMGSMNFGGSGSSPIMNWKQMENNSKVNLLNFINESSVKCLALWI